MALSVEQRDEAVIVSDSKGKPVIKLQEDGCWVVNSGQHVLDAMAYAPFDAEALEAIRDWCDRQLACTEEEAA